MSEITIQIAIGVAGAFVWEMIKIAVKIFREKKSKLTGKWIATIPKFAGEKQKKDKYKIRQYGSILKGVIERDMPKGDPPKKWQFWGKISGRNFIAVFWGSSIGVWFMRQPRDTEWVYDGRYLSIHDSMNEDGSIKSCFNAIPITLRHEPNGMSWKKSATPNESSSITDP
ncbi:MAG: hypothetical protein D3916_05705 [Candidatus Electrothrix sp. MAN1_4]|nr:hypothetical protein [Candidatus Electrothrix sp. MAN1_4]